MSKQATNNCYMIEEHRALFERLGGLPETTVQNLEWLYMLKEDTRQSLAIEGHFATQNELEAVLGGRGAASSGNAWEVDHYQERQKTVQSSTSGSARY